MFWWGELLSLAKFILRSKAEPLFKVTLCSEHILCPCKDTKPTSDMRALFVSWRLLIMEPCAYPALKGSRNKATHWKRSESWARTHTPSCPCVHLDGILINAVLLFACCHNRLLVLGLPSLHHIKAECITWCSDSYVFLLSLQDCSFFGSREPHPPLHVWYLAQCLEELKTHS